MAPTQITVFTGFLGSGKTTVILALLKQLPKSYNVVLLKNEFGDVEGSKLAEQSSVTAVSEILNGCMCCILVGQMKTAILEIRDKYCPDRIIIESSGSALPATLALQIRQLQDEFPDSFKLDSIVTVIDAENFTGYEDQSPTARLQAKFCDVLLINKWEEVTERQLDVVMDHLHTLNDLTPKLKCQGRNGISSDLIFGIDTKLYMNIGDAETSTDLIKNHHDEVEICTIWKGARPTHSHSHSDGEHAHASAEVDKPLITSLTKEGLEKALAALPKDAIYRVKGIINVTEEPPSTSSASYILNWAFGRFDLGRFDNAVSDKLSAGDIRLTMMGERGETKHWGRRLAQSLEAQFD